MDAQATVEREFPEGPKERDVLGDIMRQWLEGTLLTEEAQQLTELCGPDPFHK